ncbi:hypothetical protein K7432_013037 [Basidiobolus ranarum]|uniref:Uncharacterized protein n=1 Tax=Basidiobolus ranarum TaxID=34480 RepID=A0ABR2VRC5_9FUNG
MNTQQLAKATLKSIQGHSLVAGRLVTLTPRISVHRAQSKPAANSDITNYQYPSLHSTYRHQSTNKSEFSINQFFEFIPSVENLGFGGRRDSTKCLLFNKPYPTVQQSAVDELFEFVPSIEWFNFGYNRDMNSDCFSEDGEFDLEDLFDTLPSVEDINLSKLNSRPEV